MTIPRINQQNIALNMLPPSKRVNISTLESYPKWKQWFIGLASQMVWLHSVCKSYIYGSANLYYNDVIYYNVGDRVNTVFGVFECIISNYGVSVTNSFYWYKITPNFIGVSERVLYQKSRIVLEYALNRQFGYQLSQNGFSGFRQPESYSSTGQLPLSDIYISSSSPASVSIVMYQNRRVSNTLYDHSSGYFMFGSLILTAASSYQFTVNIPSSVYGSIDSNPVTAEAIVRQFVDKYCLIGVGYSINTY